MYQLIMFNYLFLFEIYLEVTATNNVRMCLTCNYDDKKYIYIFQYSLFKLERINLQFNVFFIWEKINLKSNFVITGL